MPKAWGKSFVALIPKKEHPSNVLDFWPISLCNVSYKIITKLLTNRLKPILNGLISKEQCGFIAGRTPMDNILTVQEIFHYLDCLD